MKLSDIEKAKELQGEFEKLMRAMRVLQEYTGECEFSFGMHDVTIDAHDSQYNGIIQLMREAVKAKVHDVIAQLSALGVQADV